MENQLNPQNQMRQKPNNYLVLAIITTFLCCNVTGVVSIVYAARVDAKWNGGDYQGAINDSKNAKLWGLIGLIGGAALIAMMMLFYGAAMFAAFSSGGLDGY